MSSSDPLDEAAAELNRRIARHQRRLVVVTAVVAFVSGLAGAGLVLGVGGWGGVNVRATAWLAAAAFAAPFFTVFLAGDLLSRASLRRLSERWAADTARRYSVSPTELSQLALPVGLAPPSAGRQRRARTRFGLLLLLATVLAVVIVYEGGYFALVVCALVGVMLTATLHWFLGWRPPR